ncbi:hypothetical protein [Streptomyces pactum]|nr:hypothetical protein [Streptomyces pactum]
MTVDALSEQVVAGSGTSTMHPPVVRQEVRNSSHQVGEFTEIQA